VDHNNRDIGLTVRDQCVFLTWKCRYLSLSLQAWRFFVKCVSCYEDNPVKMAVMDLFFFCGSARVLPERYLSLVLCIVN
jgi:hypothetical protein